MEYPEECRGCKVLGSGIECGDCGFYPQRKAFFDSIAYPICPLNFFFEGDEDKCDRDKCDFDLEYRFCTMPCTTPELRKELMGGLEKQDAKDRM